MDTDNEYVKGMQIIKTVDDFQELFTEQLPMIGKYCIEFTNGYNVTYNQKSDSYYIQSKERDVPIVVHANLLRKHGNNVPEQETRTIKWIIDFLYKLTDNYKLTTPEMQALIENEHVKGW